MESGLNIQIKMSAVLSESLCILGGYLALLSPLSENYYLSEVARWLLTDCIILTNHNY